MSYFERHYTLEEARGELPFLRSHFQRIHELIALLKQRQMEMERIQVLIASNGYASRHPDYGEVVGELQKRVQEITDKGIEIKDIERGLIDFPHWREGEEVFLCWLYGEADIEFWHTLEDGFGGRTPLSHTNI